MPRFVILEHDLPTLHWDFMLEEGESLTTWRLPQAPGSGTTTLNAVRIGNHRLAYLDYEGPVSGNRGTVKRWEAGTYQEIADDGDAGRLLRLHGLRWSGSVRLMCDGDQWHMAFIEDDG